MLSNDYRIALVTGASSGIGNATVRSLRERGLEVHAVARRAERLQTLRAQTGCEIHTADLRDRAALEHVASQAEWDVVVNNAGVIVGFEDLHEVDPDDIDTAIDINVRAVYHLLRATLPGMVARGRGHVVNIGSMAGMYALKSSVYGGTKGAIHLLGRNLRIELEGSGVRMTEIAPGRVETEIYRQGVRDPDTLETLLDTGVRELEPKDIADAIVYALGAPAHVNVNLIELQPTEQTYGGSRFVRFPPGADPPGR